MEKADTWIAEGVSILHAFPESISSIFVRLRAAVSWLAFERKKGKR
jgi:hypothetical protein